MKIILTQCIVVQNIQWYVQTGNKKLVVVGKEGGEVVCAMVQHPIQEGLQLFKSRYAQKLCVKHLCE